MKPKPAVLTGGRGTITRRAMTGGGAAGGGSAGGRATTGVRRATSEQRTRGGEEPSNQGGSPAQYTSPPAGGSGDASMDISDDSCLDPMETVKRAWQRLTSGSPSPSNQAASSLENPRSGYDSNQERQRPQGSGFGQGFGGWMDDQTAPGGKRSTNPQELATLAQLAQSVMPKGDPGQGPKASRSTSDAGINSHLTQIGDAPAPPARSYRTLQRDPKRQGKKPRGKCGLCGKEFQRKDGAKRHELKCKGGEGREQSFPSAISGATFDDLPTKNQHKQSDLTKPRFICETCHQEFSRKENLQNHEKSHGGGDPCICDHCGKHYVRSKDLQRHQRKEGHKQTPKGQFICYKCGKSYKRIKGLKRHQRETKCGEQEAAEASSHDSRDSSMAPSTSSSFPQFPTRPRTPSRGNSDDFDFNAPIPRPIAPSAFNLPNVDVEESNPTANPTDPDSQGSSRGAIGTTPPADDPVTDLINKSLYRSLGSK